MKGTAGVLVGLWLSVACGAERPDALDLRDGGAPAQDDAADVDAGGRAVAAPAAPPPPLAWPPLQASLPTWEIVVDESQLWRLYEADPWFDTYVEAEFRADDFQTRARVRWRGAGARTHPKKSWKVKLPDGVSFEGRRRLNLLAEWLDGGYLTDKLAYDLMAAAGVPAPRSRYVNLLVNGEYRGVYTEVEDVDKAFLAARGLDRDANIYRCGSRDCELKLGPRTFYQHPWEKKTNQDEPWDDLWALLELVGRTPEGELEESLSRALNLDAYLRYLAVSILISNHGIDDSGSFLVHDRARGDWRYVPWDLNNAKMLYGRINPADAPPFAERPLPIYTIYDPYYERIYQGKMRKFGDAWYAWSVLSTRIWDRPALRTRVLDYVEEIAARLLAGGAVDARIDAMAALIARDVARDPTVSRAHATRAAAYMKGYWAGRLAFLAGAIPAERAHGATDLVIEHLAPVTDGVAVTLRNRGDNAASLEGLVLTTELRDQFQRRLTGALPAGGTRRLVLPLDPRGGEVALFDGVHRWGAIDAVFYGALPPSGYGRTPPESEDWGTR